MTDEQRTKIIAYARTLNSTLPADTTGEGGAVVVDPLLVFVVDDIADRVLLYLNREDLPDNLLRVMAKIVVTSFQEATAGKDLAAPEQAISSVSDNGQTVSYRDTVTSFYASADDAAIFGSFSKLIEPYRRVKVVGR